jgi:nucleoside-diphosphate-sugar epimerase
LTFTEDIPRPIRPEKTARCEIDKIVLSAAHQGIRTCVLCPTLIFGEGKGLNTESIQVPRMIQTALAKNGARFIGRGQNIWSTVHIDDLTMAYCLALEKAEAGSFFFLSSRQIRFVDLANTIQQQLGLPGEAKSWPVEEASKEWGLEGAHFAFGSNSQVSSAKARMVLGWLPSEKDVLTDLARVCAKFKALKTNN